MFPNETNPMKEIHAIRIENFERTKNLSPEERSKLRSETAVSIVKHYGLRLVPIPKSVKAYNCAK
jgi:hypothetical protein